MEKYMITNTTVKPVRRDASGKDVRTALERVGHPVQFRDENDRTVALLAGQRHLITKMDGGILGLQRGGFVKIEPVKDIAEALAQHAYTGPTRSRVERKSSAVPMGTAASQDDEGAVNPDGEPNFVVTAKRGGTRKRKQEDQNVAGSGDATKAE